MGLPSFIIGGAPKAGTTSLFSYLDQHPEVFTSNPKEPHYLASREGKLTVCGARFTRDEYEDLFSETRSDQVAGEASTWYLQLAHRVAPKAARMIPEARWIFLLRDPVNRAYSDYWYHIYRGNLSSKKRFAEYESSHWIFEASHYLNNLKSFYDYYSRNNILVLLTQDLAQDPDATLERVCSHIDVDSTFSFDTAQRQNVTSYPRSLILLRTIGRLAPNLSQRASRNPWLRPVRSRLLFSRHSSKPEMTTEVRARLVDRFESEILELSRLIDRDLSDWLRV
jgi:hypothetical protein